MGVRRPYKVFVGYGGNAGVRSYASRARAIEEAEYLCARMSLGTRVDVTRHGKKIASLLHAHGGCGYV